MIKLSEKQIEKMKKEEDRIAPKNKIIDDYLIANQNLISEFYKIYYNEGEYPAPSDWDLNIHMIWVHDHGVWAIWINDDFRDICQVYTAVKFEIPEKILFAYHDLELERAGEGKPVGINLYNYFRQQTVPKEQLDKEEAESLKRSEENAKYAEKKLKNIIKKKKV